MRAADFRLPSYPTTAFPAQVTQLLLGFDFGTRCIGVAIGNTLTRQARPLAQLDATTADARFSAIQRLVDEWNPSKLVVGVPRHPDGAAHAMTATCERFARQLQGRFGLPVERVDERYSSAVVANDDDIDANAAAVILQQWLDSND